MRKLIWLLALTGLLVFSFTPVGVRAQATTLKILSLNTDWCGTLQRLTPEFEKENNCKVVIDYVDYVNLYAKEMVELASATGSYDLIAVCVEWVPTYAASSFTEPLEPWISKYQMDTSGIVPSVLKAHQWKGKQYGMPVQADSRMFFYQKALFAEAGVTGIPQTWDQFFEAAKKIQSSGHIYGSSSDGQRGPYIVLSWAPFFFAAGGVPFIDNKPQFASEPAIQAAELYAKIIKELSPPGAINWGHSENIVAMQQNKIASCFSVTIDAPQVIPTVNGPKWAFGLYPLEHASVKRVYTAVLCGWVLSMVSASTKKDLAAKFIAWAIQKKNALEMAKDGASPCQTYVFDELPTIKPEFKEYLNAWHETLDGATPIYPYPNAGAFEEGLGEALSRIASGSGTAKAVLTDFNDKIAGTLKQMGYAQ